MDLSVDPVALLVDELHAVSQVAVHLAVSVRNASVTHQDHDLVDGLGVLGQVVPEHGRVIGMGQVGRGVAFLGVDEVRELWTC